MKLAVALLLAIALTGPALAARRVPKTAGYHGLGCRHGACAIHRIHRWNH